jgi:hypothetical protein
MGLAYIWYCGVNTRKIRETMTMSTLDEDGITTDRLLELMRKRISQWEKADSIRAETEAAEAFTRAFAELDAALRDGGTLPAAWAGAAAPEQTGVYPVRELLGSHEVRIPGDLREDSGL